MNAQPSATITGVTQLGHPGTGVADLSGWKDFAAVDCAASLVVPHKRVRRWLSRPAKAEKVPPPVGGKRGDAIPRF